MSGIAAIVLAAGPGSRMRALKQLLVYRGRPLIEHSIGVALEAGFDPVIVVLGAQADKIRAAIATFPVEIIENQQWESGMGSSVSAGVKRLEETRADSDAVAILLADQAAVEADDLRGMRKLIESGPFPIIAAEYSGIIGVPALFKREFFSALASLPAHAGARELLRNSAGWVRPFPLAEAAIDIDTPEDFLALTSRAETRRQT